VTAPACLTLKGVRCGVNICADVWEAGAADLARAAGAEILLVLNASPYHIGKRERRTEVLRQRIASYRPAGGLRQPGRRPGRTGLRRRFVRARLAGRLCCQLPQFEEALAGGRHRRRRATAGCHRCRACRWKPRSTRRWCSGCATTSARTVFRARIIGLSGGIDSALTLCIAVDALGADKVRAVMMPSPYTAELSLSESREMVRLLGVRYDEIAIEPAMLTLGSMLEKQFAGLPADTTEENLQARIRGMILMALSNKTGSLVLTTGNKSEMAVGYCTLYGDMAGGFRGDQGHRQDAGLSPLALAQHAFVRHSRADHQPPALCGVETRTRPTRTVCRPTQCSMPSSRRTWKRTSVRARSLPVVMPKPTCAVSSICSRSVSTSVVRHP
jgi:hypothetical protein